MAAPQGQAYHGRRRLGRARATRRPGPCAAQGLRGGAAAGAWAQSRGAVAVRAEGQILGASALLPCLRGYASGRRRRPTRRRQCPSPPGAVAAAATAAARRRRRGTGRSCRWMPSPPSSARPDRDPRGVQPCCHSYGSARHSGPSKPMTMCSSSSANSETSIPSPNLIPLRQLGLPPLHRCIWHMVCMFPFVQLITAQVRKKLMALASSSCA